MRPLAADMKGKNVSQHSGGRRRLRGLGKQLLAAVATLAMSIGLIVVGSATAANAALPSGVGPVQVLHNGSPIEDGAEVKSGDSLRLLMQYTPDAHGQVVEVKLAPGVSFSSPFPNNDGIDSIVPNATNDGVIITFKDPWPANSGQGVLDFRLTPDTSGDTHPGTVEWTIGEDTGSTDVIYVKDGDEHENVGDGFAKAVTPGNLDSYILKDQDGNYLGINTTAPNDITARDLDYTLTISTPAGATRPDGFQVEDLLPPGLSYVSPLTITATETTWDENGYNPSDDTRTFTVDGSTANSFDGHVVGAIEGPSVLRLTYKVRVTDVDELDDQLQAAFDARNGSPGNYEIFLTNTATFDGDTDAEASVRLRGTVAGPCVTCGNLTKTGDLTTETMPTQPDGTLLSPIDLGYTVHADLAAWDGHSPNFELNDNMVITDNLLSQAQWNLPAPPAGLSFTGNLFANDGSPIASLTNTGAACPATAALFAVDANVGKYCLDGNKLMINVGKYHNRTTPAAFTNITVNLPAQLTTVTGLPTDGDVEGGERYRVRNTATFNWGSQTRTTPNVDGFVVVPDADNDGAVNDSSAFVKQTPASVNTTPGQPADVTYTFRVNTLRTGTPAASTRIVDHVDTRYFDIDDASDATVTGSYVVGSTTTALLASDFIVAYANGDLTIELSPAGATKAAAAGGTLNVSLTLTTRAFDGKETIDIRNSADLYGSGPDPLFESSVESQATSFGAESESRKHVYDRVTNGGEWSQLLAPGDAYDASTVYVYRLQFIGHAGFGNVVIIPETDTLPAGLEFLGFVNEADVATGANPSMDPLTGLPGNLQASFDENTGPSGTITLSQMPNTQFTPGATTSVYFAARVTDPSQIVVNSFGNSVTEIVPDRPSIDIEKWTEEGADAPEYGPNGELLNDKEYAGDFDKAPGKTLTAGKEQKIRFTVSNDGVEPLVNVNVSDELASGKGKIADLVCHFPAIGNLPAVDGTFWAGPMAPATQFECEGTLPALQAGDTHGDVATVTAFGQFSGVSVTDGDWWFGHVEKKSALEVTGAEGGSIAAMIGGALVLLGGGALLMLRRRKAGV